MSKIKRDRGAAYPTQCRECGTISPRNYQRCKKCNRWLLNTDQQKKDFTRLIKKLAAQVLVQESNQIKEQKRRLIG
jgi:predicted ATP-dependent serine protease